MNQLDILHRLVDVLEELRIPYAVVGSFASGAYGEPRMTRDIDVVAELTADKASTLACYFPLPDFYLSEDAARQAVSAGGQFNIIHPASGNKIDVIIAPATPWGRSQMRRKRRTKMLPDLSAYLASPEDVILGKLLYYHEGGSEKHLRDITGILRTSGELVDRAYVEKWAADLGVKEEWQAVLSRLEKPQ